MKFLILFLIVNSFSFAKELTISEFKLPAPITLIKAKLKNHKVIATRNNLDLFVMKNIGIISDKKNALFSFEYKTEFTPEHTIFIFNNQSKIFSKNYHPPRKVFLKITTMSKENALDKFLYSSLFTLFNQKKIEVVSNLQEADEIINIDTSVVKMPANYMRRIYLVSFDQKQNKLWEADLNSPGKLDGIRRMVPAMILSSNDFIMKDKKETKLEISGVQVRNFFFEIVAMNLGTKYSIINY